MEPQSDTDQLLDIKKDLKEIKEVVNSIKGIKEAICNPKVDDEELDKAINETANNTPLLQTGGSRSLRKFRNRNKKS